MHILDRYLGRIILQYTLISMVTLLGLFTFATFIDQLGDLGRGDYDIYAVIRYVLLVIPGTIYDLFPMTALLGTIIGLSILANDSELIVMRASGVSMLQITSAALKMGGLFIIAAILVGELVAPYTETRAQREKTEALQKNPEQQTLFGFWLRDRQTYINIGEIFPDLTLSNLKLFELDPANKLRALISAESGKFEEDHWRIDNIQQTVIRPGGETETVSSPSVKWRTSVTPQTLSVLLIQPEQLSFLQLVRYISHLHDNNQKTAPYELAFWNKIMLPLSTAVMVILAIPFVFANIRSGTLGQSLFFGIMLGIGFYVANKSIGYLVLAYELSPMLGATLPVVGFLVLAMVMMRQIE
ncbi:MAG: LPS export ABC transporter permease LptG [Gammaproteobacteria bacterium]|nr:LPS export ABC transporter permease LptG [Gammaproteobacteria bacterium]